jgi:hypothetical protein
MSVGSITLQQLFRHPYVLKVISRIKAQGNPLQNFYGLGLDNSATESIPAGIRSFSYDIFDHTRQLATVRPPKVGPKRGRPQKTGTRMGHIMRSHDSLPIAWEDIINTRPHGARIGTLDRTGQNKVTRQIKHYTEKYRNLREWVISRMFRGGFDIKFNGDEHYLVDTGSGDKAVDFQLPAAHKSQLAVGPSSANVIDVPWDDPSADLMSQFFALNKAAERISGYVIEHAWINSTTLGYLMNNTVLQAQGGAAFRIWETAQWKDMSTIDGSSRKRGFDVQFRAMPWITFHAYDGVLQKGSAQYDSTAESDVELLIPDGRALLTPSPGEWVGFAEGSEPVTKTVAGPMEILKGFATWQRPMTEPSGLELLFIDNFFPIPYNEKAWFYATVTGF